jgi:hypothetical protein
MSCRDLLVVGFTTTYAISAYHHSCCEFVIYMYFENIDNSVRNH